MKIVIHALHFAEYASRLAVALAKNHEVLVVLDSDNSKAELSSALKARLEKAVKLLIAPKRGAKGLRHLVHIWKIHRAIAEFGPDLIHTQESPTHVSYWSLMRLRSVPLVLTVHDHVWHSGEGGKTKFLSRLWEYYVRRVRYRCDGVIVHGKFIAMEYRQLPEGIGKSVYVVFHGALAAHDLPHAAQPVRVGGDILFFGRIEAYKGLGALIDACDLLAARGASFRLVVAGRGRDLERHRARLAERSWAVLDEAFIAADDVGALFDKARVVALPYVDATQSGVGAIAIGRGCPVVATRVGSLPEVVFHEETGLLVPPGDPAALSDAIFRLLTDDALHASLTRQSLNSRMLLG